MISKSVQLIYISTLKIRPSIPFGTSNKGAWAVSISDTLFCVFGLSCTEELWRDLVALVFISIARSSISWFCIHSIISSLLCFTSSASRIKWLSSNSRAPNTGFSSLPVLIESEKASDSLWTTSLLSGSKSPEHKICGISFQAYLLLLLSISL